MSVRNRALPASMGLLVLLGVTLPSPVSAAEADARASLAGDGTAWVGERVVVRVDLASTGASFSHQRIRVPEVVGGVLLRDASQPVYLSESRGGTSWQLQRYELSFFAHRAGVVEIPPIPVVFDVSDGYGQPSETFERETAALRIEARLPPGAEPGTGLVTSRDFEVEVSFDPAPENLVVGDAVTRTITRRAADVAAMAFVPFATPRIDGLAVYPKQPRVQDDTYRGSLVGERSESVTFLAQRPGDFEVPAEPVAWWDPRAQKLHMQSVGGVVLAVDPNPALGPSTRLGYAIDQRVRAHPAWAAALVAIVLAAGVLLWRSRGALRRRFAAWQVARRESEAAYFARVRDACRSGSPAAAHRAILAWLLRAGHVPPPGLLADFAARGADEVREPLARELSALELALVSGGEGWSGRALLDELVRERRRLARREARAPESLAPLNPRGAGGPWGGAKHPAHREEMGGA